MIVWMYETSVPTYASTQIIKKKKIFSTIVVKIIIIAIDKKETPKNKQLKHK